MVAEFEADLIRLRTREGMRVAKAKGRLRGKQPKLNPRQEAHLVTLHRAGEHSTAELGDLFGVSRSTVYRAIQRDDRRHGTTTPAPTEVTSIGDPFRDPRCPATVDPTAPQAVPVRAATPLKARCQVTAEIASPIRVRCTLARWPGGVGANSILGFARRSCSQAPWMPGLRSRR
jgi:Helix-turn-helix domain of resolvase